MHKLIRYNFVLFSAILAALGCGGGGGGGSQTPALNPPSQVAVVPAAQFGTFTVSWAEPSPAVEGYEIEARVGAADFQKVGAAKVPVGVNSTPVTLNSSLPELTIVAFRLRSTKGSAFSVYSNEALSKFPLKPPSSITSYYDVYAGGMRVSWHNNSTPASTVIVEKAVVISLVPGVYSKIFEGPASNLTMVDPVIAEDTFYSYRISVQGQGEKSLYATTDSSPIALLPPRAFSINVTATGAMLSWDRLSPKAVELQVQRTNGFDYNHFTTIASVPVGSTQFFDAGILGGFYSYRLVMKSGSGTADSQVVWIVTPPVGNGLILSATLRTMPSPIRVMSAWGDEAVLLVPGTEYGSYVVTPPKGATWPARTISNVAKVPQSGFSLDSQGRPHVLFRRDVGTVYSGLQGVIHEWFNGSTWVSDELFRVTLQDPSAEEGILFALAPDGVVHAAWRSYPTQSDSWGGVWYGTNRSGTWESTQLKPDGAISDPFSYRLAVDSSGVVYVSASLWNRLVLFSRPPGINSFTQELVPIGDADGVRRDPLELRPFGSRLAIFYTRQELLDTSQEFMMCLIKEQGHWGQPVQLAARPGYLVAKQTLSAASAETGRLVFAVNMRDGVQVFTLRANDTWDSVILALSEHYDGSGRDYWLGFNNQDKFWCAVNGSSGLDPGTEFYAWYHE